MSQNALATIRLDIDKALGRIKPMHAVGQPPTLGWNDYSIELSQVPRAMR